jgi:membrane protein YdbS with pleckstrin-like domain
MDVPERHLSPVARWVWRAQQIGLWGAVLIAGSLFQGALDNLGPATWLVRLVGVVGLVGGTWLVPRLRWARWRWDVRDEGIDIQHGTISVRRTLVPWIRVQHVDTRRGLWEQAFDLSTVVVHTAAGSHTIPLLGAREAEGLRERIAGLARTNDREPHADTETPPPATPPPPPHDAPRRAPAPAPVERPDD